MANNLNYTLTLNKARMDAVTTAVGNAGKLYLFSGSQPAAPSVTHTETLIAGPFTLGSPFASAAATQATYQARLSPTLPSNVNASSTGQATWFRVTDSSGSATSAGVVDGSAATSGADMTVGPATSGQPVAITAWTMDSNQ